jgi:hypothetical protein
MQGSLEELGPVLERLVARLEILESRVTSLEQHAPLIIAQANIAQANMVQAKIDQAKITDSRPSDDGHPLARISSWGSAGIMPTVGKVFLALAGAFILRALAESGSLPRWPIIPIALAYAGSWLFRSARIHSRSRFASTAYSIVAALIFAPMVWELTLSFRILAPQTAAAILAGFAAFSLLYSWKSKLAELAWPPTIAACITALALMVATGSPASFVGVLLLITALAESAPANARWAGLRATVSLAADMAILALIVLYTSQNGLPPGYSPLSNWMLLALISGVFVISATGLALRPVLFSREAGVFDVFQTSLAFLLAFVGALRLTNGAMAVALGIVCLVLFIGCYGIALTGEGIKRPDRRFYVFATWAALLLVTAAMLAFGVWLQVIVLGAAAAVSTYAGSRFRNYFLSAQGVFFLIATFYACNWLTGAARAFMGMSQGWLSGQALLATVIAVICYVLSLQIEGEHPQEKALRFAFAALAAYAGSAVIVECLAFIVAHSPVGQGVRAISAMAVARTLLLCLMALAAAVVGARYERAELVWLAYTAMAVCTLKVLLEDMRMGSPVTVAMSLFLYGGVWVLLPRISRSSIKARATSTG